MSKIADIAKLIEEVEEALYSSNVDIIECLNKARVIAKYYNDKHTIQWIEKELTGYLHMNVDDIPEYRKIQFALYETIIGVNPSAGLRYSFDNILATKNDYCYREPMAEAVKRSGEAIIRMTMTFEGDQGQGNQVECQIQGLDLKNIITKVSLILTDYIHEKSDEISKRPYETPLMKIFNRFHRAAKQLEKRYSDRDTIKIEDEYDTQDLLYGLLTIEFNSVQDEEYGPRFAGKRPRIDFFLRLENIGIEVKKVRDNSHAKKLNEEIIIDKEYYSKNPDITQLYFFIYDPESLLLNREDFIEDLEKNKSEQFDLLKVIIKPDL